MNANLQLPLPVGSRVYARRTARCARCREPIAYVRGNYCRPCQKTLAYEKLEMDRARIEGRRIDVDYSVSPIAHAHTSTLSLYRRAVIPIVFAKKTFPSAHFRPLTVEELEQEQYRYAMSTKELLSIMRKEFGKRKKEY